MLFIRNKERIILTIICILLHPVIKAQKTKNITNIVNRLGCAMLFNSRTPQEKVYLHFDNTGYFKGERIWYKAYIVRTDNGMPTDISRVLYVELVNPGGEVVKTQKYPIKGGTAHGDILLDSILGTGFYEVRAYTRYMTNWGSDCIFSRVFPIFKAPEVEGDYSHMVIDHINYRHRLPDMRKHEDTGTVPEGIYSNDKGHGITVRFYPEGGDLVKGLRSRVAFTVTDAGGDGFPTSGTTGDTSCDSLDSMATDSSGRGIIEITADSAPTYISLKDDRGEMRHFKLPIPKEEGCALTLDAVHGDDINFRVASSANLYGEILGYALIHNGNIVECDTFTASPSFMRTFRRLDIPEGVNQLTVFDKTGRIHADRLFFVCPPQPAGNNIIHINTSDAEHLSPCSKVKLSITSMPESHISFSAVDYATMTGGKRGNIYTWMLLSSEIKGYIANPEYYFEADDEEHRYAADMLMLTQGWRRYDWKLMAGLDTFKNRIQIIEDNLYLHGTLKEYKSPNSAGNVKMNVYLYNDKGQSFSGHTKTDSMGCYAFRLPDITGEYKMQIYTKKEGKRKNYRIAINRRFSPSTRGVTSGEMRVIPKNHPQIFPVPTTDTVSYKDTAESLPASTRERVLPTVKVNGQKRYFTNDENVRWYNEHDGRYYASIYYDIDKELDKILDNGEDVPTLAEYLLSRNKFFNGDTDCTTEDLEYKKRPIVWYMNNTRMTEGSGKDTKMRSDNVQTLPVFLDEVKSLYIQEDVPDELEHRAHIYIYTHPVYSTESQKGLRHSYFQGFNVPTTFKMEDYSVLPPMEDFRRTIYWNPDIKTDKNGKATVEFYNNSTCTQMYISAEGMTRDGQFVVYE